MQRDQLERAIEWGRAYRPEWDTDPDQYADSGAVVWGHSRRLGKLLISSTGFKAYLGVQHIDPSIAGWGDFSAPQARFFVSWFVGLSCLGLRTAPTMPAALDLLWEAYCLTPYYIP
ncbi:MAG: hypothetical protein ACR2M0_14440 [Chloroflexia bacterium]